MNYQNRWQLMGDLTDTPVMHHIEGRLEAHCVIVAPKAHDNPENHQSQNKIELYPIIAKGELAEQLQQIPTGQQLYLEGVVSSEPWQWRCEQEQWVKVMVAKIIMPVMIMTNKTSLKSTAMNLIEKRF